MKSELTLALQTEIWKTMFKMGTFGCHEVGINGEIVDYITYNTKGEWRCFEIKVSKQDFYSKHKKTFVGDFNYFVMPKELYEQVKKDITNEIGVYAAHNISDIKRLYISCVKKPTRQNLKVSKDVLLYSIIKSMSREYDKSVRGTRPLVLWKDYQLVEEVEKRGYKIDTGYRRG